jgi:predicted RNA-binding protein associated with RNAse of E/G family
MNIIQFLKNVLVDFEEITEPLTIPSKATIEVGNISIPTYGEILGIEKDIFEQINNFQKKIVQDLLLSLNAVKEKTNHGELDTNEAVLRLMNAIKCKGNYILRSPSLVTEFDSSLIEGYDDLISWFSPSTSYSQDLTYEVDGILNIDLRTLANTYLDSWIAVGVQGETLLEMVVQIYKKSNFIVSGKDQLVNILDVLEETVPEQLYRDIATYENSQNEYFIVELLAYTRSAVSHNFVKNSLLSDLDEAKEALMKEFIIPDKKTKNSSKTLPKQEEKTTSSDGDQTSEK